MTRDQILANFRKAIVLAGKDTHDIVSAYEEVIEKFSKQYPQYAADFQTAFDEDDEENRQTFA